MELRNIKRDKKGDVTDVIVFMLIAVFLAISFIVVLLMNDKIKDVIEDTALNDTSASESILDSFDNINSTVVQRGYILFMAILLIGVIVSSFLVRIHPGFLFLYILILGFAIFIAVFAANMYSDLVEVEEIAEIADDQPMITYVMEHLVLITLAVGALSMIIVFSKIFSTPGSMQAGGGDL